jgi:hypothetical protein
MASKESLGPQSVKKEDSDIGTFRELCQDAPIHSHSHGT